MERKLQITGKGKLGVTPDIIILSFIVSAQEWEYERTVTALNIKVEQLRVMGESVGVERKSLKTKDFSIRKETKRNKQTDNYEFNGFKASHNLELELPLCKAIINNLLGRIAKGMESLDFNISFGVKDAAIHQLDISVHSGPIVSVIAGQLYR